jgi:hypothetical protein
MPVWEAQYVIVLASKTGWSESFIRHELPLSRGWSYYHAARLIEGEKCRWPGKKSSMSHYVDKIRNWVRAVTNDR